MWALLIYMPEGTGKRALIDMIGEILSCSVVVKNYSYSLVLGFELDKCR